MIQGTLNQIQKWADQTGLSFSETKTHYIIFSNSVMEKSNILL